MDLSQPTNAAVGAALFASSALLPAAFARLRRWKLSQLSDEDLVNYWLSREHEDSFLKEVLGDSSLAWVREENKKALQRLGDPTLSPMHSDFLNILDSKEKIPYVVKIEDHLYNFWQDEKHVRGLWRRTSLESYLGAEPDWEVVIDLDELGRAEKESWVYRGFRYCDLGEGQHSHRGLLCLSRGGSDATVVREFDLVAKDFVQSSPFFLPEAKSSVSWKDLDTLYVGTDFKDGQSLTKSGYARQIREWKRGTELSAAPIVFLGEESDVAASQSVVRHRGHSFEWRRRSITFYTSKSAVNFGTDKWCELDGLPDDASVSQFADQAIISLRSDWEVNGVRFLSGSVIATSLKSLAWDYKNATFVVLFEPSAIDSLQSFITTRNYLVFDILEDICSRLVFWRYEEASGEWRKTSEECAAVVRGISIYAYDDNTSDLFWLTTSSFTLPSRLHLVDAERGIEGLHAAPTVKALPKMFNLEDELAEDQHMAVSKDGTKVPYFIIRPRSHDIVRDGPMPTLLYGYGGFEISLTPNYTPIVGKGWLERKADGEGVSKHRCYVVANIRGGGEYGPKWHQAALREKRQKAYDDFIAVAEDLIARKLTVPALLGIRGGSNGGLLVGNVMVQRPDLFAAVCCAVPLLNMKQYDKLLAGASWVAEYGQPDNPDDWAFLQRYSAYHNVRPEGVPGGYPALLMTTSTRDDRVHPYHARCFAKRIAEVNGEVISSKDKIERGEVVYYENIEGGHGGAADNRQRAFMEALYLDFLWKSLR